MESDRTYKTSLELSSAAKAWIDLNFLNKMSRYITLKNLQFISAYSSKHSVFDSIYRC